MNWYDGGAKLFRQLRRLRERSSCRKKKERAQHSQRNPALNERRNDLPPSHLRPPDLPVSSSRPAASQSAFILWTVQTVDMLPMAPVEETATPFMNQMVVFPLVSRHKRSLMLSSL